MPPLNDHGLEAGHGMTESVAASAATATGATTRRTTTARANQGARTAGTPAGRSGPKKAAPTTRSIAAGMRTEPTRWPRKEGPNQTAKRRPWASA